MDYKNENATVFFQLSDKTIVRISNAYRQFELFYTNRVLTRKEFIEVVTSSPMELPLTNKKTPRVIETASVGKTIFELWENSYYFIVVQNLNNSDRYIVFGNEGEIQRNRSGEILGKYTWYSNKDRKFNYDDLSNIEDYDKPIWEFINAKTRCNH